MIVGMVVALIWAVGALTATPWLLHNGLKHAANIEDFVWDVPCYLVLGLAWPFLLYQLFH